MSARELFLGIDSGTQGTKALLFDAASGSIVAQGYRSHELLQDPGGCREQDPLWWIEACESLLAELLAHPDISPKDLVAIGVSGQQHGCVVLDRNGAVIRPAKLWCDTATATQADTITRRVGGPDRVIDCIGNAVAVGFTASKILWLAENEPHNYEKMATVLLPHDYINFWLTGERKTECGDASGTAYFDVSSRTWNETLLRAIDPSGRLAECLPEVIDAHACLGIVKPELVKKFNLRENVYVASGGGDNMIAAIGTGNVKPGVITASLGTSGAIYAHAGTPVVDPNGELAAFCSSTGGWLPLVCTMNVTVATELTRSVLQLDTVELNAQAAQAKPGSGGIVLLPYFNGERTPALPTATASLHGLTPGNFSRPNLCRAAMEGATLGLRYGLDVLKRQGIVPREIRLVGGGAKSSLWRQITADVFACPVVSPTVEEAGALGAALQAIWCALHERGNTASIADITDKYVRIDEKTRTEPNNAAVNRYDELYVDYLKLDQALRPTYRESRADG